MRRVALRCFATGSPHFSDISALGGKNAITPQKIQVRCPKPNSLPAVGSLGKNDSKNNRNQRAPPENWSEEDKVNFRRIEEQDEEDDSTVFRPFVHKRSPGYYNELCKRLAADGKIAEAVAVVEKRMLEDRVRPEKYNYVRVIHILAKYGQARKAMEFFKKIRSAGYQPAPNTISSLMNACANAPKEDREFALQQTKWLFRREKHQFSVIKNTAVYFAAMKCFARHGDVEAVFQMADEMLRDGWRPDRRLFTCLLSAALSDKQSGFALALQIWQVMKSMKLRMDVFHYQNLLRVCKDCGVGEKGNLLLRQQGDIMQQKLQSVYQQMNSHRLQRSSAADLNISLESVKDDLSVDSTRFSASVINPEDHEIEDRLNNTQLDSSQAGNVPAIVPEIGLKFSMIGGIESLLASMTANKVAPDLKILSLLCHLMPNDKPNDDRILKLAKDHSILLDTEFFNRLVYRRAMRRDRVLALDCLDELKRRNLQPDVRTFGALAIICKRCDVALNLLRDMQAIKLKPNQPLLRVLLNNALHVNRPDFRYAKKVLDHISSLQLKPDFETLKLLEERMGQIRRFEVDNKITNMDSIPVGNITYAQFETFYNKWLQNTGVEYFKDPKLTILQKTVDSDDLRLEEWEKPWVKDEITRKEQEELDECEFEAVP